MKRLSYLSLLPLGLATSITETIPYQLQRAAETLLTRHVDTSFTTELLKHGCWCAKLDSTSDLTVLGGNKVVDELDQLCKNWAKTRRCGKNTSENCEFFGKNDNYQLSSGDTGYSTGTLLCPDSDACLKETCEVDVWFLNEIEGFRLENSGFVADESHACTLPFAGRPGLWPAKQLGYNNCPFLKDFRGLYISLISCAAGYKLNPGPSCGLIPPCDHTHCQNGGTCYDSADLTAYICACVSGFTGWNCEIPIPCSASPCQNGESCTNSADYSTYNCVDAVDAHDSAGVDNSDKQLSMTLVWSTSCDLDLHAIQPDGIEIFHDNKGPHPSTGRLDDDVDGVGPNGLAVENISWITAPSGNYQILVTNYGGCTQGMPYKVYVQIDGQYSVYENVAPAEEWKSLVVSFNYSSLNGRSFKTDVDFDVSESLSATFSDQEVAEKKNFFGF